jgi:hypothetical protein
MNIEYHFYVTYIIALRAGYSERDAFKIAYSSQYTDDNDKTLEINKGGTDAYSNYISQTMDITRPRKERIRIHPMFHFCPGTTDEIMNLSLPRHDGKLHLLNTIPGNQNAITLIENALNTDNLYRIGIATHMFVDTYSHQNFAGINDTFNAMEGFINRVIPNVGHADARHNPDLVNHIWRDGRHTSKHVQVDNNKRFLDASEHIFSILCSREPLNTKKRIAAKQKELRTELAGALGTKKENKRIDQYTGMIGRSFTEYDKSSWYKEAVSMRYLMKSGDLFQGKRERVYQWKDNHKQSDWYKFQQAVKAHQKKAEGILKPVFERMEVEKLEIW